VNGQINGVMSEVNGAVTDAVNQTGVNDTGLGTVVGSGDTHISNPVEVGHTSDAADSSTNWNEVWK